MSRCAAASLGCLGYPLEPVGLHITRCFLVYRCAFVELLATCARFRLFVVQVNRALCCGPSRCFVSLLLLFSFIIFIQQSAKRKKEKKKGTLLKRKSITASTNESSRGAKESAQEPKRKQYKK